MTETPRKLKKGERTQERILQAALELFSEHGFSNTSVRDIAAHADITHAGLIHHFPSKDDMLVRILEYREEQDARNAARFTDYGLDRLFAWLIDVVQTNATHPDRVRLFVLLSAEATNEQHPARSYFVRRYARVLAAIEQAFTEHFAVSPPRFEITPREAAESIVALMDGLQIQWLIFDGALDMPALVRTHLASLGIVVDAQPNHLQGELR